jgi:hypothetical protein
MSFFILFCSSVFNRLLIEIHSLFIFEKNNFFPRFFLFSFLFKFD